MKEFEQNIIQELLQAAGLKLSNASLNEAIEYSGSGYFLTIKDSTLPKKRTVLDTPNFNGMLGDVEVGYLAFIENSELMLECYSYNEAVTPNHREQGFVRSST